MCSVSNEKLICQGGIGYLATEMQFTIGNRGAGKKESFRQREGVTMSWSPELCIGEFRPWPESICVVRDKTDETRRYVLEKYSSVPQCLLSLENAKLRELVRDLYETAYFEYPSMYEKLFLERIREMGIEVDV